MAWGIGAFVLLALALGAAIAHVTGAAAVLAFVAAGQERHLAILPQRILSQIDVFTFLSMPLFILAGELMNRGGITRALVDLSMLLVGRARGGLGHVNVAASLFLSGISGSAVADAAALSRTLVPAMRERGYDPYYAAALTAASAVIGPIIPPSIVMIFYGAIMNVSVAALFAAGIVPGLLLGGALIAYNAVAARRGGHPGGRSEDIPPLLPTLARALPALSLPVIIVSGIVFGVMTPTEAAGMAVLAALAVMAVYDRLDGGGPGAAARLWAGVSASLRSAATLTGSIFMILFAAAIFGYLMAIERVPEAISGMVAAAGLGGLAYVLLVNAVLLAAGMVMDVAIALVLLVPLLVPPAIAQGADPVHMGVVVCLNLTMGLISPPVGGCLMVVATITQTNYLKLAWRILPFFLIETAVLLAIILVPETALALPRALGLVN